ncbi:hypothetical protein A2U01_0103652, partial [Trifolium medium]|nr:hypothetical protein [Trifolium medium]
IRPVLAQRDPARPASTQNQKSESSWLERGSFGLLARPASSFSPSEHPATWFLRTC